MDSMDCRVLRLEAQVNAMAQAWLYLAAETEMKGGFDLTAMKAGLRQRRWPRAPEIDEEARSTLNWLCDQLDEARAARCVRARREQRDPEGDVAVPCGNVISFELARQAYRQNAS